MEKILLTSADYIKNHTALNFNTFDKMVMPAIERAQDINLSEAIGDNLVKSIQTKIKDNTLQNYEEYKTLLNEYVQPYLCYQVVSNIILELGNSIGNSGIDIITDEHKSDIGFENKRQLSDYWQKQADAYCGKMIAFLQQSQIKEYCCKKNSSATTTIFLGGARGKRL